MSNDVRIHDNIRQSAEEHPFAQYVRILGKGKKGSRSFTYEEALDAMTMALNGEVEDIQLGAFLMLIRVKEETPEELAGFVRAVKNALAAPAHINADIDWSSYAGKRRHLPWFVYSAYLVASMGYRVFMHGVSGHTNNRIYTETIIDKLGLAKAENWSKCESALNEGNFCYMPLQAISPRLADLIDLRNTLGLRSPVHSLSRLINPLDSEHVIQGVFHPPYLPLHQEAAQLLDYSSCITLKGEGGEIERNPDNDCTTFNLLNGELNQETWPKLFGKRHVKPSELSFEDMVSLWRGKTDDEYGIAAVVSTAAIALKQIEKDISQEKALEKAQKAWDDREKDRF
ncbi:glycosyl transferase [Oleiphilus sp. HI0009]|nr:MULTISPECIES: glycosyl transferase family protein [unclassified Oleiphilus]KZX76864.1 glycosyl transferase [Oleiphilus sp. HI0009]KZX78801.1 glycosyl transferase [Oleiphilus sp. HI0009]KZY63404.1 glycosyl transferase [Oleiphilus sp. HI0066]KZY72147.1 glycosyl transferase [Oleiphilus sp. HI0067]